MSAAESRTQPTSIARMAAPLVISFWMRAAVTMVDTLFAATLGDSAVAAVGLTIPLEFLMVALWVGISTGLTSALSRAMGAGDHRRVEQYRRIGWRLVLVCAPLFTVVGAGVWLVAPRMGLAADVAADFRLYGTVLIAGSALTTFWSILPDSLVKAHQDTRSTMWAGIWSNVINVGLNCLFLFGFGWGLFGIAFSTVIGRLGGLVYALDRAARHERARRERAEGPGAAEDERPYAAVMRLAVPASLTFALMATETGLINFLLSRVEHATEAIAAYSIYYRVVLFALQPVIATSVAMLPYAAHRLGADDLDGVRRGLREASLAVTVYTMAIVAPLLWLTAPTLAGWLAESPVTARYATFALRTTPLACLFGAPFLLCRPVFEALQRGAPGLVMAAVRYLVLTGPLAWAGLRFAPAFDAPPMYGLIVGGLVAAMLASTAFRLWLARALREAG